MENGLHTVNDLNIESQISDFIQGLTGKEKLALREQALNGRINVSMLEEEGENLINFFQELNRKLENFADKLGLTLQDLESEMFNYFKKKELYKNKEGDKYGNISDKINDIIENK